MQRLKQWMYYIIIGIVSFIALVFMPMIGTELGLAWKIPNTTVGWIVWIVTKVIVAVINVMIFHCFMLQAKVNVKDDPKYKEALEILSMVKKKEKAPRSPHKWLSQQYGQKGVSIFFTTALSTIALTQALLTFDYISMLTYLFTLIMGWVFGVMQMRTAEEYWTDEFYQYAIGVKEKENVQSERNGIQESAGAGTEEQTGHSEALRD